MSLINLTKEQLIRLDNCCEKLDIPVGFMPAYKFGEAVQMMYDLSGDLDYKLADLQQAIHEYYYHGHYPNQETTISNMEEMVDKLEEFMSCARELYEVAQNSAIAYKDATQCGDYELVMTEEEIKAIIKEHFVGEARMGVSYKDGEFVLLFFDELGENNMVEPYFVKTIATGCEEAWDRIEDYVNCLASADEFWEIDEDEEDNL